MAITHGLDFADQAASPPADSLESQLVAAGRGDMQAFAALYDAVAPRAYGLVLRILRDAHQSEEVTQEVFLQIWQTSARFDPRRGSALAWMMTVAHRRAVDRVRSAEAVRRRDSTYVERNAETSYDETAATVHASLEAATVREALATLTTVQREAIELSYFGGHTHREVSELTRVPVGTAKTRIRDGLLRLRDVLAPGALELV